MSRPVDTPEFWKERLAHYASLRMAMWDAPFEDWQKMDQHHREMLAVAVGSSTSILDAGCGYGRLLELMPALWYGEYTGVDISPDLIELAKQRHPGLSHKFMVGNLLDLSLFPGGRFDLAICVMVRGMTVHDLGEERWDTMEKELRRVSRQLLCLEPV